MATKPPLFRTVLMQSQSIPPLGGEVVFFPNVCGRVSHRSSFERRVHGYSVCVAEWGLVYDCYGAVPVGIRVVCVGVGDS